MNVNLVLQVYRALTEAEIKAREEQQKQVNGTVKNYNAAMGTLESRVLVSARRFRALDVSMDELPRLSSVDEGVRTPVAPELMGPSATQ